MSEEIHGYLRPKRSDLMKRLSLFRDGSLRLFDNGVSPRVDVSVDAMARMEAEIKKLEFLMIQHEVSFET